MFQWTLRCPIVPSLNKENKESSVASLAYNYGFLTSEDQISDLEFEPVSHLRVI
jgi:hypothetical protein